MNNTYRSIIVGDFEVGKTSILRRLSFSEFNPSQPTTIGVDYYVAHSKDRKTKVSIWDSAGQERFISITQNYFRNAKIVILVYSVMNRASLKNIDKWYNLGQKNKGTCEPFYYLVGNKIDGFPREVKEKEGKEVAAKYGMTYFETSAKANIGIEELFNCIFEDLKEWRKSSTSKKKWEFDIPKSSTLNIEETYLSEGEERKGKCCC